MNDDTKTQFDELEELKAQADQIGLKYRKDITAENLRGKVKEALADKSSANDANDVEPEATTEGESKNARRIRKQKEASELVRIHVTCMNPNKAEYDGDYISAGNRVVGTFKKFVKFGVDYHVPRAIYNVLRDRQCQVFVTERDDKGRQIRKGKQIKEFSIAVLDPLTKEELKDLAQRQAMAAGKAA